MSEWAPIQYMGFWDVTLIFLFGHEGELFLFDCPFDETVEDYVDHYNVYCLPQSFDLSNLPKDWTKLHLQATRQLGKIPVRSVQFDESHRREINTAVLEPLAHSVRGK
jgi:hypothetical protein